MALSRTCAILAILSLGACATSGPIISSGERYQQSADLEEAYMLGSGDQVRVTVFNEPTLSGDFFVSAKGVVSLPLVGAVDAGGKTIDAVATEYAGKLVNGGYLRDPRVSAEVIVYRPFFILGEVGQAGQYPYVAGMSVLDAIATANGFSPRAKRSTVYIRRRGQEAEQEFKLTPNLRVMPGDTIRLGERYF